MAEMFIPKTIHYCWFGKGKKPDLAIRCIESWEKYCPDYKVIEWNESNFDINLLRYTKEAYEAGKYAYVTDVVRLYVLYHEGGIYMDTDVEVLRPLDSLLAEHAFSGFETDSLIPTGIMAAEKMNLWIRDQLQPYEHLHFLNEDGSFNYTTNVQYITDLSLKSHGLKLNGEKQKLKYDMVLYPKDYFCPKDYLTRKINLTKNTYTIHHFSASWKSPDQKRKERIKKFLKIFFGEKKYQKLKHILLKKQ